MQRALGILFLVFAAFAGSLGCSSGPAVQKSSYAKLSDHRTFEFELPVTMRGIEKVLEHYKVMKRDPDEVDPNQLKKLTSRKYETDWVYGESRDKYVEYQVNGSPRRKNLQTRYKFFIDAQSRIGGTDVTVQMKEEVEHLKEDGTPAGYETSDDPDTSRIAEMLEKIQLAILALNPSNEIN